MVTEWKSLSQVAQQSSLPQDPMPPSRLASCRGTDLPHLDPDLEFFGHQLDHLPEIHPVIGSIIKNGFGVVALVLHIIDLHLEIQPLGDLPGTEHGVVLVLHSRDPFFNIGKPGSPVNLLHIGLCRDRSCVSSAGN